MSYADGIVTGGRPDDLWHPACECEKSGLCIGALHARAVAQFLHPFNTSWPFRLLVHYRGQVVLQKNKEPVLGSLQAT